MGGKMNNEPVAFVTGVRQFDPKSADTVLKVGTPLYTHPADLTDEEIDAISDEVSNLIDTYAGRREFARAILQRASEK